VSKRTRERDFASRLIDSEFEQALEENEYRRKARDARQEQKTQQLCRQVQRALNLALAGEFAEGTLDSVYVCEVSAMGGAGRLLVHVALPDDRPAGAGQMADVWYDFRQSSRLVDEAPGAYKDIRAVARAQRDLVKVVRVLRPVLNYKGT